MLRDVKVLEFLQEDLCFGTRLLGDLGAFVVSIKSPNTGCKDEPGFIYHNLNKYVFSLNVHEKEGREVFFELAEKVDVIVTDESATPILKDKKYKNLFRVNGSLSHLRIKGPRDRRWNGRKYEDVVISALSGQMWLTRDEDGLPLPLAGEQTLYTGALYIAIATLLLSARKRMENCGSIVELDLEECAISVIEDALINILSDQKMDGRRRATSDQGYFTILPCKDGYMQMTVLYQLESLLELLGIQGPFVKETAKMSKRKINLLINHMGKWMRDLSREEVFYFGQAMHFPWAPIVGVEEVLKSPQLKARRFFRSIKIRGRTLLVPFAPYKIKGRALGLKLPDTENDTKYICLNYLKMPLSKYRELREKGII